MRTIVLRAAVAAAMLAPFTAAAAADPALLCEKAAGLSLVKCVKKLTGIQRSCFNKDGAICDAADADIVKALGKLADKVTDKCGNDATVQASGYPSLTLIALVDRLQAACIAETESIVARSYGGPHGAAFAGADDDGKGCIDSLLKNGSKFLTGSAKSQTKCVIKERKSGNCDTVKTAEKVALLQTKALDKINADCAATPPVTLVTLNAGEFLSRTAAQSRCMTAMAHPDVSPLDLDCGPRAGVPVPARGSFTQVVLDEATWGTRCGDGSSYAFQIRLAPIGHPVENVVLQMQGGGVCIFEADCESANPDLFEALSDGPETDGIMSNDPLVSPFANWTKVYLPYCTQDVFIGGGATSNWSGTGGPIVHRFGSVNTRAALRYLRDVLWAALDEESEGYRANRIKMLFGGTSAGAFGTLYNYHYVLDDLQWIHASAWPDAALALDNGNPLGIANLALLVIPNSPPLGWAAGPFLPPYCFAGNCAVGEIVYAASAPRLKREPEQQFLVLSNQVDSTQVSTTFFPNAAAWINEARDSYCDTAGTNGLHYFLPAITASTHVVATRETLYTTKAVDGIIMRDWLANAMTDPDNVPDAVEEGTLTVDIPGVNAFPCTID